MELKPKKFENRKPYYVPIRCIHESKEEERLVAQNDAQENQEEWEILVKTYGDALIRFVCTYVHDVDTAQDIVQDTLVRGYRQQLLHPRRPFHAGWLYQVARNLAIDWLRQRKWEQPLQNTPSGAANLLVSDGDLALQMDVERTLRKLRSLDREALWLFYYQEWPIDTIAQHYHTTPAVIKGRLYRARRRFQHLWKEERE